MDRPRPLNIDLNVPPSQLCETPPRSETPPFLPPLPLGTPPPTPPLPLGTPPRTPPPQPPNPQLHGLLETYAQVYGFQAAVRAAVAVSAAAGGEPAPQPAQHPGEAGFGVPQLPCASCGRPEVPGSTLVCDACERGFHLACVRVWPPMPPPPPPPPPGPPGARRPRAAANEDWICPECEMRGARANRWKLGPVKLLDINAVPPSEEAAAAAIRALNRHLSSLPSKINVADGAHMGEFATTFPHFESLHLKGTTLYDGKQFVPAFDLASCSMRSKFTSLDRGIITDGSIAQRSSHLRKRKRDLPHTSLLAKFSENNEFGRSNIFMDPSFFIDTMVPNSTELRLPKFLVKNSNRRTHNCPVGLPVQYRDFFVTNLGEIDIRASYHNCYQIWPVGFTSYWHDRVTGSLFECEVCDGGNFGPIFKVRRLPCSMFPLPDASTILFYNGTRKADTMETKETSSLVEDAVNDSDDNVLMLLTDPSETEKDFLSCLSNDMEGKCIINGCNDGQMSNMIIPTLPSHPGTFSLALGKEANIHDKIGEFCFEGTTPSSVWRMISCALIEACQKMYKQYGHLVFFCTHDSDNHSFNHGSGCQKFDDTCSPLTRFCSSYGPSVPHVIEKENDVESTYVLLREWLTQDRIGLDLEFVQEIIESLPNSRACSNYRFLSDRSEVLSSLTVVGGSLSAVHKNGQNDEVTSYGRPGSVVTRPQDHAHCSHFGILELPPGNPISHKLPPELAGDVFEIWEFLLRFAEVLGLKVIPSYEELEDELIDPWPICANQKEKLSNNIQHSRDQTSPMNTSANVASSYSNDESGLTTNEEIVSMFIPVETYTMKEAAQVKLAAQTLGRCSGVVLPKIHLALLRVLFGELLSRVAIFVDPNVDPKESKSRRGRKRETENSISTKEIKIDLLTANELTWPELARRYVLAVCSVSGCMDLSDISSKEGVKLFRCLQGDGGVLCGALAGVAGMEKEALLFMEAENLICDSSTNEVNKVFLMDHKDTDTADSPEVPTGNGKALPDWAKPLEPVRKLPTNVGTRIRKCVYEALEKKPPEWARKILEHSISKEVYKGNASGPTKKAVLSVLAEASRVNVPQNPEKPRKERNIISISEAILKKCRIALRRAISSDESKLFGNLLGTTLMNSNENEDEGILGFPGMVSRPLDFRTIDIRLAMGAYCGSWEAFLEDVREVIQNLHTAFGDRPDVVEMVEILSQSFESFYETEVLDLVQKFDNYNSNENVGSEIHEELHDILIAANNIPKAPWEDGVCKVCGIDRDDDSVLLCDKCDSEYHTYCLNPPLARIPEGNWYCPSCISGQKKEHVAHSVKHLKPQQKKHRGEEAHAIHETLNKLAAAMEEEEYWELTAEERVGLLKFLCDEVLNTALIREHLDQCSDKSGDLQQKIRALNFEWKDLKYKEELFARKAAKENADKFIGNNDVPREEVRILYARQNRWGKNEQHFGNSSGFVMENEQHSVSTASDRLEEAGRGNIGTNLNQAAEGTPVGQASVGRPLKSDTDIPSIALIECDKSLGLSERSSWFATDQINGDMINEESVSSEQGEQQKKLLGGKSSKCENLNMTGNNCAERTSVTSVVSTSNVELPSTSFQDNLEASTPRSTEQEADNSEMNTLLNEISKLQDSISVLESQLTMASLRREFLGKDSLGRLYWVIGRPGKRPWLVVDGSMLMPKERNISMVNNYPQSTFNRRGWNSSAFVIYESDEEIRSLVDWLKDYDPWEKELKDSIFQWQRLLFHQEIPLDDPQLIKFSQDGQLMILPNTRAAAVLEQNYGLQLDPDTSDLSKRRGKKIKLSSEERTCRCDCLEPIWPSRNHCLSCHQTYLISTEFEGHNGGKCSRINHCSDESKENDEPKGKGAKYEIKEKDPPDLGGGNEPSGNRKFKLCPYDFEEISRKFITNDSNKEIVNEIGLIGSNGVPSFVPSASYFLDPMIILNQNKNSGDLSKDWISSLGECQVLSIQKIGLEGFKLGQICPGTVDDEQGSKSKKLTLGGSSGGEVSSATNKPRRLLVGNGGLVPDSSLRPLIGRNFLILKQLKINLLDIDAALPEEALRASKSRQIRRCSWRAFVKEAESICQMVVATNLLESMIKTEFLKNDWWYWSSFTAAIKTSTISSLALRIYTLDYCIIYIRDPLLSIEPADNTKAVNKGKKRKEPPESSG